MVLGRLLGVVVGREEGDWDGRPVGRELGVVLGRLLGVVLGAELGPWLGNRVGWDDGVVEGKLVGVCVGFRVPATETSYTVYLGA